MNSKIKVDKFVIVAFLLCMVCTMAMQAKAYDNFKVSVYVRAYEVDKMKDIHWLDSRRSAIPIPSIVRWCERLQNIRQSTLTSLFWMTFSSPVASRT